MKKMIITALFLGIVLVSGPSNAAGDTLNTFTVTINGQETLTSTQYDEVSDAVYTNAGKCIIITKNNDTENELIPPTYLVNMNGYEVPFSVMTDARTPAENPCSQNPSEIAAHVSTILPIFKNHIVIMPHVLFTGQITQQFEEKEEKVIYDAIFPRTPKPPSSMASTSINPLHSYQELLKCLPRLILNANNLSYSYKINGIPMPANTNAELYKLHDLVTHELEQSNNVE